MPEPQLQYNIFDLGFNKHLSREMPLILAEELDNASSLGNVFLGGSPSNLSSGELIGNLTIKDGYLQSSNFVSGSTGWRFTPDSAEINVSTAVKSLAVGTSPNWFRVDTNGNIWSGNATLAGAQANTFAVTNGSTICFIWNNSRNIDGW